MKSEQKQNYQELITHLEEEIQRLRLENKRLSENNAQILKDIEGRKLEGGLPAQSLADRYDHYQRIVKTSQEGIWTFDVENKTSFVNDKMTTILGYLTDEMLGKTLLEFMDSNDETSIQPDKFQDQDEYSIRLRHKSGHQIWVSLRVSPLLDDDGLYLGALAMVTDITKRRLLEQQVQRYTEELEKMVNERTIELQQTIEQVEAILESSSDAVALIDKKGNVVRINMAFEKLLGESVHSSIESFLGTLQKPADITAVAENFVSVIYDAQSARNGVELSLTNNQHIDGDLILTPVKDIIKTSEHNWGMVFNLRDITELKELERQRTRFVANAAHDLGNPVANMKVRIYLLKKSPESLPESLSEHLAVLEAQIERLDHLVEDLRTLSNMDRGLVLLQAQEFDINALVKEIVATHQALTDEREQTLIFQPFPGILPIKADKRKCERIIVNLVANAIHYTPGGGTIRVQTQKEDESVIISVEDTGIGIEEKDIVNIFEPFYRTDKARMIDQKGTGLGLSIVKQMTEAHGGKISVSSTVGKGTRFVIRLPRSARFG